VDCDTDHYLVVAKVRETGSEQTSSKKIDMERKVTGYNQIQVCRSGKLTG
jgi:hypothetical protein